MQHDWGLKAPALIISVVGGNRDGIEDMYVKKVLEEGLAKVLLNIIVYAVISYSN